MAHLLDIGEHIPTMLSEMQLLHVEHCSLKGSIWISCWSLAFSIHTVHADISRLVILMFYVRYW